MEASEGITDVFCLQSFCALSDFVQFERSLKLTLVGFDNLVGFPQLGEHQVTPVRALLV